jgi:hypothetical protein
MWTECKDIVIYFYKFKEGKFDTKWTKEKLEFLIFGIVCITTCIPKIRKNKCEQNKKL